MLAGEGPSQNETRRMFCYNNVGDLYDEGLNAKMFFFIQVNGAGVEFKTHSQQSIEFCEIFHVLYGDVFERLAAKEVTLVRMAVLLKFN